MLYICNMSCKIDNCQNSGKLHRNGTRYFPRGFCSMHYKKWAKENRKVINSDKLNNCESCSVTDCKNSAPYKKGMCNTHYIRYQKHGDVEYLEKRREGQTKHPLYNTYHGMRKRCCQINDKDYHKYGGIGIKICERWSGVNGFFNFIEDMGEKPESTTIDRIDVDGDYSSENCRWADIGTQNLNKRNVKFRGVCYYEDKRKYRARITVNKVSYELGSFTDLDEAITARKQAELKYLGKILEV